MSSQVCVPRLHISLGVYKKRFEEPEDQCFGLDKTIQLQLAVDSEPLQEPLLDGKMLALRTAQQHCSQVRQFHEKANSLQEVLNLQTLQSQVTMMPAYITTLQNEIETSLKMQTRRYKSLFVFFNFVFVKYTCPFLPRV